MRRIAVIIDLGWAYQHHHGVYLGIQRYAQQRSDWDCVVLPYVNESLTYPGAEAPYDGMIARATPRLAARAKELHVPLVNVWRGSPTEGVPTVAPDMERAGTMAAEHLLGRGCRRFAYLGFRRDKSGRHQLAGFRGALQKAGLDCDAHLIKQAFDEKSSEWQRFLEGVNQWIDTWTLPIGVFVTFDTVCRYLADTCRWKGLNIPHDVLLVGSSNEPVVCLQAEPTLTSIDLGYERVGFKAAGLLDRLMDGEKPPAEPIKLTMPKELVPRGSTDMYAVDDPLVSQAMRFIGEQGHTGIGVEEISRAVHTTRRTLERRFREVLGHTIAEELTRLKLERVKRELVETDLPIKKIASQLGFSNGKQMSKTFARVVGISPQEYRNQRRPLS